MKKINIRRFLLVSLLVLTVSVLISVVIMPSIAFATGPEDGNFGGNGKAWVNDYDEHYSHIINENNRKAWTEHCFAVPGQGGQYANENAAVTPYNGYTFVDPQDYLP